MMQAAVLNNFQESLEIKQVEIPKPGPDDVLIKTTACGVCHTDLHFIRGGKRKTKLLFIIKIFLIILKIGKSFDNFFLVFRVMKGSEK
jgi:D-arabinose 1-dehydrogenase-like Zn-dependent alcohol dehydrogenase